MSTLINQAELRSNFGSTTTHTGVRQAEGIENSITGQQLNMKQRLSMEQETIIGTWNLRTLNTVDKLVELEHEMVRYMWDIYWHG